jgi:hypothetical protein
VKTSPLEQHANRILAENPSDECVVLSETQLTRIAKTEIVTDPYRLGGITSDINSLFPDYLRFDKLRWADRERKRAAASTRSNIIKREAETVQ